MREKRAQRCNLTLVNRMNENSPKFYTLSEFQIIGSIRKLTLKDSITLTLELRLYSQELKAQISYIDSCISKIMDLKTVHDTIATKLFMKSSHYSHRTAFITRSLKIGDAVIIAEMSFALVISCKRAMWTANRVWWCQWMMKP